MKKRKIALALVMALGMTMTYGVKADCAVYNGWEKSNGSWYYYTNGSMKTGWVNDGGTWYYLKDNGVMTTGWQKVNGTWYYLNSNGSMKTGWLNDGGTWYYLNGDGSMKTGWLKDGSTWYYLNGDGSMKTGWLSSGSTWYFLKSDGSMASGWYHVTSNGAMVSGTIADYNGKQYYFNKDGAWVENTSSLFRIFADDDKLVAGDKSIVVNVVNSTDHDFEFNADDNYIQKKDENGLWNLINIKKDSKKIGKVTVKAHSGDAYTINADTFENGKLEAGQYKVYNYLGDKYYESEFVVKEQGEVDQADDVTLKADHKVYDSFGDVKGKFTITNNTDSELTYAPEYSIQIKENGKWKDVDLKSHEFNELACILKPHETVKESFYIADGELEEHSGDFRLVKNINGKEYYAYFELSDVLN